MSDRGHEPRRFSSDEHTARRPISGPLARGSLRRGARAQLTPHSHKFRAATTALIGFALGAIAVVVVVISNGTTHVASVPWSAWSPPDSGLLGARDIADHIAPLYRLSATDQLDVVTVSNLVPPNEEASAAETGTVPTSGLEVAVRPDPRSSAVSLLGGNTIAYNLCGIGGSNCSIGIGTASAARLLLLRREALELALYTFKYISGTDNVVAVLPPGHTTTGCTGICPKPNTPVTNSPITIAVLFVRSELTPWLSEPLADTLPEEFPPTVAEMASAPEAGLVDQITARGLFSESLVQAQDGSNLLVLSPLPPS